MIRKYLLAALAILLLLSSDVSYAADNSQKAIEFEGVTLNADAQIIDGTLYLPLRTVCEELGYNVQWLKKDGITFITIVGNGKKITVNLTDKSISSGGHRISTIISSGEGSMEIDNKTYLAEELFFENFAVSSSYNQQSGRVELQRIAENPISVKTVNVSSDSDELKITIQFPQIYGLDDTDIQDAINSVFRQAAVDAENEGFKNAYELGKVQEAGYTGGPNKCETYFAYEVKYNKNGLLSVVLQDYQYAGGAHGMTVQTAHTFDLNSGKELKLADLMQENADFTSLINNKIRSEIDRKEAEAMLGEITGSEFTTISANQDFFLANDAIVIYFQQYEHFPYAAGIQEFPILYSELGGMLKQGL